MPGMEDTDERNEWLCKNCRTFSNVQEAINYLEGLRNLWMKSLIPQLCWGEWNKRKRYGRYNKASYAAIRKVLQANLLSIGGGPKWTIEVYHTQNIGLKWKSNFHSISLFLESCGHSYRTGHSYAPIVPKVAITVTINTAMRLILASAGHFCVSQSRWSSGTVSRV